MTTWGMLLDHSGLNAPGKRALLRDKQAGRCGACGVESKTLVADHNHRDGRLRGLLCRRCNSREGHLGSLLIDPHGPVEDLLAYLADPPAGRDLLWDFPEWWSFLYGREMRRQGVVAVIDIVDTWGTDDALWARLTAMEDLARGSPTPLP